MVISWSTGWESGHVVVEYSQPVWHKATAAFCGDTKLLAAVPWGFWGEEPLCYQVRFWQLQSIQISRRKSFQNTPFLELAKSMMSMTCPCIQLLVLHILVWPQSGDHQLVSTTVIQNCSAMTPPWVLESCSHDLSLLTTSSICLVGNLHSTCKHGPFRDSLLQHSKKADRKFASGLIWVY